LLQPAFHHACFGEHSHSSFEFLPEPCFDSSLYVPACRSVAGGSLPSLSRFFPSSVAEGPDDTAEVEERPSCAEEEKEWSLSSSRW